jgi:hypothetical protein
MGYYLVLVPGLAVYVSKLGPVVLRRHPGVDFMKPFRPKFTDIS